MSGDTTPDMTGPREADGRIPRFDSASDVFAWPDPTPEPDAGDVEALARVVHDALDAHGGTLPGGDELLAAFRSERFISDWLAAHDAEVRRDTAERIAQAIEQRLAFAESMVQGFPTEHAVMALVGEVRDALAREEASRG